LDSAFAFCDHGHGHGLDGDRVGSGYDADVVPNVSVSVSAVLVMVSVSVSAVLVSVSASVSGEAYASGNGLERRHDRNRAIPDPDLLCHNRVSDVHDQIGAPLRHRRDRFVHARQNRLQIHPSPVLKIERAKCILELPCGSSL